MNKQQIQNRKTLLTTARALGDKDKQIKAMNLILQVNFLDYSNRILKEFKALICLDSNYAKCLENIAKIKDKCKWWNFKGKLKAEKLWWKIIIPAVKVEKLCNQYRWKIKDIKKGRDLVHLND